MPPGNLIDGQDDIEQRRIVQGKAVFCRARQKAANLIISFDRRDD